VKPSPAPIHYICNKWQVSYENVLMIGDETDDIQAGAAAGSGMMSHR